MQQHDPATTATDRSPALLATAVITGCALALYVSTPLVAPVLVVGCPLIAGYWVWRDKTAVGPLNVPALFAIVALLVWFALSTLWSPDRKSAFAALLLFAVSIAAVFTCSVLFETLTGDARRHIAIGLTLGLGFAMWLSLEEHATGLFGRRLFNYFVPMTRPHSILTKGDGNWIIAMMPYVSNKNTAAAMILTWPMILISRPLATTTPLKALRYATILALAVAVAWSDHETSKAALIVAALVFTAAKLSRATALGLVVIGWIAATLAIVPVSLIAYGSGAHLVEAVQYSGRHRLVIWGHTAERALDRPFGGHGLASTRVIDEMTPPAQRRFVPGTKIPEGTNMHSHNVFMQTWHETGAIGGFLMFLAGLPILAWLRSRPDRTAPELMAAFAAAVTLASLSWSLVATWYIATFAFFAIWCLFADAFVRHETPVDASPADLC